MDNIDNSLLVHRAVSVGAILQDLTAVQLGPTDWFSVRPRELRLVYEMALSLSLVQVKDLTPHKALRYLRMVGLGSACADSEYDEPVDTCPGNAEWLGASPHSPIEAFLYVGPPQSTLFYEKSLPPARASFALAYEVGGYLADLLSYGCMWLSPRSMQCYAVWEAFDSAPEQYQRWLELRALPRIVTPHASDRPASALDIAVPFATPTEIIARELLAPWSEVAAIFCAGNVDRHGLVSLLMEGYGLPAAVAARYHNDLRTLLRSRRECPGQSGPAGHLNSPSPPHSPSQLQSLHWGEEPPEDELDFLGDA
jgi:hypothetical protein